MSLQMRVSLAVSVLVLLLLGSGAGLALWQERGVEQRVGTHTLETTRAIQRLVEDSRRRELQLSSSVLASNPSFVGYIAQALSAMNTPGEQVDTASIRDLLEERRGEFGFDIAAILDTGGRSVVVTGDALRGQQTFSATPLFNEVRTNSSAALGVWSNGGRLLLVSIAPMLRGSTVEAMLLTGYEIDADFAKPIALSGHAGVVLLGTNGNVRKVAASTLDAGDEQRVLAAFETLAKPADPNQERVFDVTLAGGRTQATVAPLFGAADTGVLVSVVPLEQKVAVDDAVRHPMWVGGAVVLLLTLVFAWMLQRRVLKPVDDLADLSERMLRGDVQLIAKASGSSATARIGTAINHILTELRGYKEAIEQRRGRP